MSHQLLTQKSTQKAAEQSHARAQRLSGRAASQVVAGKNIEAVVRTGAEDELWTVRIFEPLPFRHQPPQARLVGPLIPPSHSLPCPDGLSCGTGEALAPGRLHSPTNPTNDRP